MRLERDFYRRPAIDLARDLLGRDMVCVSEGVRRVVRIVETEAYLGVPDLAAHTAGGRRTARNESMYLPGGHLYVYFTYGMHYCMNVVASVQDDPVAVLIRAGQPREGIDAMQQARPKARKLTDLCSGPAKLCQAMGIDRRYDGLDLRAVESPVYLEVGDTNRQAITACTQAGPRIGVAYAGQWASKPLRFYLRDNPHVSRP